eukprot:3606929-Rhodomonas_salina.1
MVAPVSVGLVVSASCDLVVRSVVVVPAAGLGEVHRRQQLHCRASRSPGASLSSEIKRKKHSGTGKSNTRTFSDNLCGDWWLGSAFGVCWRAADDARRVVGW